MRLPPETVPASLEEIAAELQRKLWRETGGQVQISVGWDTTPLGARARMEYMLRGCVTNSLSLWERVRVRAYSVSHQ